jgi:hypothetical protein
MRVRILIFCFALSLPGIAYSQLSYGIKGGLNLADVVINNLIDPYGESDFKMKAGLLTGVFVELDLENRFTLSSELLYSVKGVKTVDTNIHFHYIALPILAAYKITDAFRLEAGIELGYLISATSRYGNVNAVWDNKTDLGLDAGLRYHINKIVTGVRFNAGVSSVIRNTNSVNGENIRYQNRVLSFSVGYLLGQRKL